MVFHYGVHVDENEPTTGVFNMNNLECLMDDAVNGIDLTWEEHKVTCEEYQDKGECNCDLATEDMLIGFREDGKGKFEPDPEAEYSAICRFDSNVVQVVKSQWGIRCALCSPCYPGQGDGDTPGTFLAFAIPPEVVGKYGDQTLVNRIFSLETNT